MKAVKFTFDNSFDGTVSRSAKEAEEALQRERERAFEEGRRVGQDEALQSLEAGIAASLDRLLGSAGELFEQHVADAETAKMEAARLAHVIAGKLASALIRKYPLEEVEGLIAHCLELSEREPRLVVRVAEQHFEAIKASVDKLKANAGFPGEIVLLGDAEIEPGDGRVEWADGGAERSFATIAQKVGEAIERFASNGSNPDPLSASDQPAPPQPGDPALTTAADAGTGDPDPTESLDV